MSEIYAELEQERARLRAAQERQQVHEQARWQEEADRRAVEESARRIRQMESQARREQFEDGATNGNEGYMKASREAIQALYAALDRRDVDEALKQFQRVGSAFEAQQNFKSGLVALLNDEMDFARAQVQAAQQQKLQEAIKNLKPGEVIMESEKQQFFSSRDVDTAGFNAYRQMFNRVGNAIAPHQAATAYINTKPRNSPDRRIAIGLVYALCGQLYDPGEGYSPQRATDEAVNARMNGRVLF